MWPGWETEPSWGSLTRSPLGSARLLRRYAPASKNVYRLPRVAFADAISIYQPRALKEVGVVRVERSILSPPSR